MTTLFDDRERAAEYGFTHDEELRFLATREATESMAGWVAEVLAMEEATARGYVVAMVDRLVGGAGWEEMEAEMRRDLEMGERPDDASEVATRYAKALALASDRLHGRLAPRHEAAAPHAPTAAAPHPHGFWGWTV